MFYDLTETLNVNSLHIHSVHHHPPPPFLPGWEVEPPTKFFKKGGLDRISVFKGGLLERGGDLFQVGLQFLHKQ